MFGIEYIHIDYSTIVTIILPLMIITILCLYIYLKLSYGFWFYAPVFHLYDFHYYLYPKGIVETSVPEKNKFTNLTDIKMYSFEQIKNTHLFKQFTSFISSHYMRNKYNTFTPCISDTEPYFTNHKHSCFISYFYTTQFLHTPNTNVIIPRKQLIGAMTTRPVQIQIKQSLNSLLKMYGYYVDYLCIHREHRKKGIAPQQIQTHYYHQRRGNPSIHINIFKREGELTGIVPLCVYPTHMFQINKIISSSPEMSLPVIYKSIRCSSGNIRHFVEFTKLHGEYFDIIISPDLSNLMDLIKSNVYYIDYVVDTSKNNEVVACYIFKETSVNINKTNRVLSCIASVRSKIFDPTMFYCGFIQCLTHYIPTYHYILVENLSHNTKIVEHIENVTSPESTSSTAYFFHNYIHPTMRPENVLILGT